LATATRSAALHPLGSRAPASRKIGCGAPIASTAAPVAGNGLVLGGLPRPPSGRSGRAAICSISVILPSTIRSRSDSPTGFGRPRRAGRRAGRLLHHRAEEGDLLGLDVGHVELVRARRGGGRPQPLVAERQLHAVLGEPRGRREQLRIDLSVGHRLQVLVDEPFEAFALAALLGSGTPPGCAAAPAVKDRASAQSPARIDVLMIFSPSFCAL
jgi:hypothetical protein